MLAEVAAFWVHEAANRCAICASIADRFASPWHHAQVLTTSTRCISVTGGVLVQTPLAAEAAEAADAGGGGSGDSPQLGLPQPT